MNLKDTLEIVLLTYNRKKYLQHTLAQLFDEKSPVKNLDFTILDNASTDGSSELIDSYVAKFPNIKHIKRPKSIGGDANIASAFGIVTKKYYWIICDDDEFNFSAWSEVEEALNNEYDIIMIKPSNIPGGEISLPRLFSGTTFVPSVIGKSENITEAVLYDAFGNVDNWFPQLSIVASIINKKGSFFITSQDIVHDMPNEIRKGIPGYRQIKDVSERGERKFFHPCYLNSLALINDKKLRAQFVDDYFRTYNVKKDFICYTEDVVKSQYNWINVLSVMTLWQKIKFLFFILFIHILYLLGFRSYLWFKPQKTSKWQKKLVKIYKYIFKKR